MKKNIALILVLVLVVSMFTACGGSVDTSDPNQGVWKATTGEMLGVSMDVTEFFGEGFTIELKSKGKCTLVVDGKKANGTWTLESGAFTVKGGGIDCKGRLENGSLVLEDVMDMGLDLYFEKEGGSPAAVSTPSLADDAGYYLIDTIIMGGETYDSEALREMEINYYVRLNEDGTSEFSTDELIKGTWEPGKIHYEEGGEKVFNKYSLRNGILTIEIGDGDSAMTLKFKLGDATAPTAANVPAPLTKNLSEALQWWEGEWYGYWEMVSSDGKYADSEGERWDCAAVIKMEPDGRAVMYLWDDYVELGTIEIQVEENAGVGLMGGATSEGGTFYEKPLGHADWIIRPGLEAYDDFMMIDGRHKDSDDIFDHDEFYYEIYLRPWGMRWDDVPEENRPLDHDSWYLEQYQTPMMEALADAVVDGVPVLIHSALTGSDGASSGELPDAGADDGEDAPADAPAELHPGEPSSNGDGYTTIEDVYRAYKWLSDMDWEYQRESATYEYVRDYIGVEGHDRGNTGPNSVSDYGDHYFNWYATEMIFMHVGFRVRSDGTWTVCGFNSSGFSSSDLEDIVVEYDYE